MNDDPSPSTPSRSRLATGLWSAPVRLVVGILLIVNALVLATVPRMPYIKIQPGSATDVLDLIHVREGSQHPADGSVLFLTVALSQRLTVAEILLAQLDGDVELREEEDYTGGLPRDEVTEINLAVMEQSKSRAIKLALEHLGWEVSVTAGGPTVTRVLEGAPADEVLRPGDVISAVEGATTTCIDEVVSEVQARDPGTPIVLTVRRDGEAREVEVGTVAGSDGRAQMGIQIADDAEFDFPVDVGIQTGQVGGPSAGLAFTLAVLDELTSGELTGGHQVAVTGAITCDGDVEPVGFVQQKALAARSAGAVMMLVPEGEAELARPHAGDMEVVAVSDLDDALEALARLGGNASGLPRDRPERAPAP